MRGGGLEIEIDHNESSSQAFCCGGSGRSAAQPRHSRLKWCLLIPRFPYLSHPALALALAPSVTPRNISVSVFCLSVFPCLSSVSVSGTAVSLSPLPSRKVDAEAAAEARKAREAQNDIEAVKALREELSVRGLAAVPADSTASSVSAAAAAVVNLEGGVAAAVAAKPEAMTAELARLRGELAAAGKLATKVEALERANARLMAEVSELRKEPSLEEIKLRVEREAARCGKGAGVCCLYLCRSLLYAFTR